MNTVLGILTAAIVAAILAVVLWKSGCMGGSSGRTRLANIAEGVRENSIAVWTDAAIAARHLLYKKGTADDHVAVAGANDVALGTIDDLADAAEELKTLFLLGKGTRTKRMVANAAITIFAPVYQAAGGKVAPTGFRLVGFTLKAAAADNDIIEVVDIQALLGTGLVTYTTTAVAAAGTTVADAGQLPNTSVAHITSDGATKGVKLPTGVQGMRIEVINNSATACELYAATGGTINGAAANASMVIPASKGVICFCTAADTWVAFDMTAKATAS